MDETKKYAYIPLAAVEGIPPATHKAIMAEFAKIESALAALDKIAAPMSAVARTTGKIPATDEYVFQRSRFGGSPELRIGPMRGAKVAAGKKFAI